jgi:hypothetical protein
MSDGSVDVSDAGPRTVARQSVTELEAPGAEATPVPNQAAGTGVGAVSRQSASKLAEAVSRQSVPAVKEMARIKGAKWSTPEELNPVSRSSQRDMDERYLLEDLRSLERKRQRLSIKHPIRLIGGLVLLLYARASYRTPLVMLILALCGRRLAVVIFGFVYKLKTAVDNPQETAPWQRSNAVAVDADVDFGYIEAETDLDGSADDRLGSVTVCAQTHFLYRTENANCGMHIGSRCF